MLYKPSLCVVAQGAKQIIFGEQVFHYRALQGLVVSIEVPALGGITQADAAQPFLGMTIDLEADVMREVMGQMQTPPHPNNDNGMGVFVLDIEEALADCLLRMVKLLDQPQALRVLFPSMMREICFWLLSGPRAGEICKLAMSDSHTQRIARAIRLLRENYRQAVRIEQLADAARMSTSSFHQHFRTLTSMTPLQFQKQLRLLEARRLMIADSVNVSEAAYQVGYESASQFSRDYSRMFGVPPKRNSMELKELPFTV
jgi:AraC-like DNA-binding protein